MSFAPVRPFVAELGQEVDFLNLDSEDLVDEIMDRHSHLLDQEDDMEQLAPYYDDTAMLQPSHRAPVTHTGPPAAKPVAHFPSAQHGQNADYSSPPTLSRPTSSSHIKSSFAHQPSRRHTHRSSFVETYQHGRPVEQAGSPPLRRRDQYAGLADMPTFTQQPEFAVVDDFEPHVNQTSSCEWEDVDDEHDYEEVTVNQNKTASNGNEPGISTNQDLKYTSLVLAESSAKMVYLCGRKMYEVMWTSQTSQRLRRSAMQTTRTATGSAANSLGRLVVDTCKGSLGGVKHYVSRKCPVLKAVRHSPRDIVRLSVARALRSSRMKLAGRALPMLGLTDAESESDIEDNYDFCDDVEEPQPSNNNLSSLDDHDEEGLDLPGFYEDDMYGDEL
ncbi:hypothetical protein N0V82_009512 [Gnomoniopsis sp. IMI 355080]|nr:hypothetical protein N0V82_009512 [Gnomoniopsis sp. IMI 355080]